MHLGIRRSRPLKFCNVFILVIKVGLALFILNKIQGFFHDVRREINSGEERSGREGQILSAVFLFF